MKSNGSWKIKKSEEIYKNPWLSVIKNEVVQPDGKDGEYTTVNIKPGVTILALDANGSVKLSKGFQFAIQKYMTGATAGGAIESGESPLEAAKRELKEETGIEATKFTPLGEVNAITSGIISSPNYLFLAEGLEFGEKHLEGTEEIKSFTVTLEKAVELVMSGEITHSASALLIMKVAKLKLQ